MKFAGRTSVWPTPRGVDPDARLCNLHLTLLHRMDVEVESFGDSVRPLLVNHPG